ncbi:E3 ubiquitin-protein ligase DTX3L-like [Astyanax mexicanus]|uniref:E3 ubiquitin-protein ligase n=1 Tax=Astyanax mexicanus TaxID=7994 RepID=A0A8T2M4C3_ASTMX|nr:E3 ubiquitin-protein ligase DTX3L-like [Astyanax mexicanus]
MGSAESKDKMHCTRYLNGDGPPPLDEQVKESISGTRTLKKIPGVVEGNQPDGGEMKITALRSSVEGYQDNDTIQINFVFEDGIQTEMHPRPGQMYHGLRTAAYLPQNSKGRKVYKLLQAAFQHKLLFTVATSNSGEQFVTFSDIPLKTSQKGGPESNGYPDPKYLDTVLKVLKSRGIK